MLVKSTITLSGLLLFKSVLEFLFCLFCNSESNDIPVNQFVKIIGWKKDSPV